ncbi:MAG: septal ring lytic transglycosylase RlpA family protein [Leptolyngbyaceae cyanobacterium SM2_5_2]|nr:septal ring lytic transglycosylase RlpA family protein [Leptolyngbyaceae cyanobacterium SM2_5_2]
MKHSLLGGLTVAVAMSVLGVPLPAHSQDTDHRRLIQDVKADASQALAHALKEASTTSEASSLTNAEYPSSFPISGVESPVNSGQILTLTPTAGPSANPQVSTQMPTAPQAAATPQPGLEQSTLAEASDAEIVTVFPHALDNNQAATIYVRSIPVVTLIGDELTTLGGAKESQAPDTASASETEPMVRASAITARLSELAESSDPADIQARWDTEQDAYVVSWQDEALFTVNSRTILPDTTRNPAEDTLQIANRLRRLLGNAPALSRVEGVPQPAAQSASQVGVVISSLTGMASWYGPGLHGRRSASGEIFNQHALTAAHRTLPFGTQVRVTNLSTGQQVVVRINDRGPFSHGRIIDLSAAAASSIGLRASGVGRVRLEVLSTP